MAGGRRLAVVVSRDFVDAEQIRDFVRALPADTVVVTGGSRRTDRIAADEAQARGLAIVTVAADRDPAQGSAGFRLNRAIIRHADRVVAFWSGKRDHVYQAMNLAREQGVPVEIRLARP
jgi:hypothetical protein